MLKTTILTLLRTVEGLIDIIVLLDYRKSELDKIKSELDKIKKTLRELKSTYPNTNNENMLKSTILTLLRIIEELIDILVLLSYRKFELDKIKKTLSDQNTDNDNANYSDFRCNALKKEIQENEIKKLTRKRDRLIEELKKETKAALDENASDLSNALQARDEALADLWKANKDLEALEFLSKTNKVLSDYQSEDANYNSENE